MSEKRKRSQNFGLEEKYKLIKLVAPYKDTILNKRTDGAANEAKNKAWIDITNTFNSTSILTRNKDSLVKLWEKMKTESKSYYQNIKRCTTQTGGEPTEVKIDPIMEQVCALLGYACNIGVQDCDYIIESQIIEKEKLIPKTILIENDDYLSDDISQNGVSISPQNGNVVSDKEDIIKNDGSWLENYNITKTPLWSRTQPQLSNSNEGTDALSHVCASYSNVNKKEDIEDLNQTLLLNEIAFKKQLYHLQLQTAAKELEIKNLALQAAATELEIKAEVLRHIKGGAMNMNNMFGVHKD